MELVTEELKEYATPVQAKYIDAILKHGSATKAAEALGVNRRGVDKAIARARRKAIDAGAVAVLDDNPKILVLDIETAPCMANVWRMWDEVRDIDAIISDWYILTVAYKWLGDDPEDTKVLALRDYPGYKPGSEDDRRLMEDMYEVLCEAEYVIAHNGDRFDIKKMNTRMVLNDIPPPTPYKSIDTLKIAKRIFGFTSNKLDYLAKVLLGERKMDHDGLALWQAVAHRGEKEAWDTMCKYNVIDVQLLERVYLKLRAWDHLHPNVNLTTTAESLACTACGSNKIEPTGKTVPYGQTGLALGYVCKDCGHQMRGRTNIRRGHGLMNAK